MSRNKSIMQLTTLKEWFDDEWKEEPTCPVCGKTFIDNNVTIVNYKECPFCGQKIHCKIKQKFAYSISVTGDD